MMTETLATHTPTEIAIMNLFLFHMAMLQAMRSSWLEKDGPSLERLETYIRRIIKSEETATVT